MMTCALLCMEEYVGDILAEFLPSWEVLLPPSHKCYSSWVIIRGSEQRQPLARRKEDAYSRAKVSFLFVVAAQCQRGIAAPSFTAVPCKLGGPPPLSLEPGQFESFSPNCLCLKLQHAEQVCTSSKSYTSEWWLRNNSSWPQHSTWASFPAWVSCWSRYSLSQTVPFG